MALYRVPLYLRNRLFTAPPTTPRITVYSTRCNTLCMYVVVALLSAQQSIHGSIRENMPSFRLPTTKAGIREHTRTHTQWRRSRLSPREELGVVLLLYRGFRELESSRTLEMLEVCGIVYGVSHSSSEAKRQRCRSCMVLRGSASKNETP